MAEHKDGGIFFFLNIAREGGWEGKHEYMHVCMYVNACVCNVVFLLLLLSTCGVSMQGHV